MKIKCIHCIAQTLQLIGLFILLTTVTGSETLDVEKFQGLNFITNITKLSSAGDAVGLDMNSGSGGTKVPVADRMLDVGGDSHGGLITPTSQSYHSANLCLSLSDSARSVTHSVTLLRISTESSASHGPLAPLTFSVDSTITVLTIEINSSLGVDASIRDPNGTLISKKLKRETRLPRSDSNQKDEYFTSHIQRLKLSRKSVFHSALPSSKLRAAGQFSLDYNNRKFRQQRSLSESLHTKRQEHQLQFESSVVIPWLVGTNSSKSVLRQRNMMSETQYQYKRKNFYNQTLPVRQAHQNTSQLDQNSHTYNLNTSQLYHNSHAYHQQQGQTHHNHQHSRHAVRQEAQENWMLLNKYVNVTTRSPFYSRNKITPEITYLGMKYSLVKMFNSQILATVESPRKLHDQLNESNNLLFINQTVARLQMNRSLKGLQRNKATNGYLTNQSENDMQIYRRRVNTFQNNQSVDDLLPDAIFNSHFSSGINNRDKILKEKGLKRPQEARFPKNNVHTNKRRTRTKRTVRLITAEDADGSAVWEIDPPNIGSWSISINEPGSVQILVTAVSSLDFTFEFLDIRTKSSISSQPIANETTLVRLTLTSQPCVTNVTAMTLYTDAGERISALESNDVVLHLDEMASSGKSSILFWLQMPDVPFYMSAAGYDAKGHKFQRLSSQRVVPRMFALSFDNFKPDPLVPGTDYKFGVHLRNKGGSDTFKIFGTWANSEYFRVLIIPNILKVEQNQIAHAAVVIAVKPSIYFIMKGELTITASRASDNVSDSLTEDLTAEPASFLQDYESPTCTTTSAAGGCRLNIPCLDQKWTSSVMVSDSLTGVRSAVFLQPPPGAFNSVQFFYSMTNRTARADYGYTCCNMEAMLLVYDYANNPAYCKLIATILDPQTAPILQYSSATPETASLPQDETPTTPYVPNKKHTTKQGWLVDISSRSSPNYNTFKSAQTSTIHTTGNASGKNDGSNSAGQTESTIHQRESTIDQRESTLHQTENTTALAIPSTQLDDGPSTPLTSLMPLTSLKHGSTLMSSSRWSTNSMTSSGVGSRGNQHSGKLAEPSTLRLAAVICGSLAGVAGLAIAVICVVFKCVVKQQRSRSWRRRSNDSDVTMGSSSEARSEGSSSADSMRLSRIVRRVEDSWPGGDASSIAVKGVRHAESRDPGDAVLTGHKRLSSSDECKTRHGEPRHFMEARKGETTPSRMKDARYFVEVRNGETIPSKTKDVQYVREVGNKKTMDDADNFTKARKVISPKQGEVEDVIFRCVIVKKDRKVEDGAVGSYPDGGGEVSQISYSPLLRCGGKTYSSMLQVQKQIEDMDLQRRSLSSAVNQCCGVQHPEVATSPGTAIRPHNAGHELRATPARLHPYGTGGACNEVPPGSPELQNSHVHSPTQRTETSKVAETPSEHNLPTRRQVSGKNFSVPESERRRFHITTSNQSETLADLDTPRYFRIRQGPQMQHDSTSFETNAPHSPTNTRTQAGIMQIAGAHQRLNAGCDNYVCCETNIPSGEADNSDHRNTPPEGIGSSQNCANYNQEPKVLHSRKQSRISQTGLSQAPNCGVMTTEELPCPEEEETRRVHSDRLPNNSTKPEYYEGYLEATIGNTPAQRRLPRYNVASTSAVERRQQFIHVRAQTSRPTTPVCDNLRAAAVNEVAIIDAYTRDEIDEPEKSINRISISRTPTTTQTPSNSRSESPDPRYLRPENGSMIISDPSQVALRHGIEHIRQKLLKFQRRIDYEIEEETRRSRGNSPCSFDNISQPETW
ncbi:hypothetical protein BsWGS_25777 [Bradybaena similaris]